MNRLPIEKRAQIIGLLVEGMSMRAVTRITGVSINTVTKLLTDIGIASGLYQAQTLVNLPCKRVQCDEIWAFCYSKEKNVAPADKGILGHGDVWTWTAIDADTKLIVSYMIGKRDGDYACAFIDDLASRWLVAYSSPQTGTAPTCTLYQPPSATTLTTPCCTRFSPTMARANRRLRVATALRNLKQQKNE